MFSIFIVSSVSFLFKSSLFLFKFHFYSINLLIQFSFLCFDVIFFSDFILTNFFVLKIAEMKFWKKKPKEKQKLRFYLCENIGKSIKKISLFFRDLFMNRKLLLRCKYRIWRKQYVSPRHHKLFLENWIIFSKKLKIFTILLNKVQHHFILLKNNQIDSNEHQKNQKTKHQKWIKIYQINSTFFTKSKYIFQMNIFNKT